MIDIVNTTHENKNQEDSQNSKGEILSGLKDEKNVSFEWDEIKFPEVKFTSVQEALEYVKRQENLLIKKNRENNVGATKEINKLLDILDEIYLHPEWYDNNKTNLHSKEDVKEFLKNVDKWYRDPNGYQKDQIKKIKVFLQEYTWDLSYFMNDLAEERKQGLYSWNEEQNFLNRWKLSHEDFSKLTWEDLIKAFKKDFENMDKIHFSYASNLGKAGVVGFMEAMIKNVFNKYQR